MTLAKVTVVCDLYDGAGNVRSQGAGSFAPNSRVTDTADHILVDPGLPIPVSWKVTGPPQVVLYATGQGAMQPPDWQWVFTPPAGSEIPVSSFSLAASPSTQYLSDLIPGAATSPIVITNLDGGSAAGGALPAGDVDGGGAS